MCGSIRRLLVVAVILSLAGLVSPALAEGVSAQWKAGIATVKVTPEDSMWMAGYAARNKPSEGKIHDLFAKALAVEDAVGTRLVIVTMDLISVPRPLRDWLETAVGKKYRLPPEGLLVSCSHTHCGPELRTTPSSFAELEPARARQAQAYMQTLQAKLEGLVGEALARLAPARLSYCHARCGFAMNRRTPTPTGFRNFPNPEGPVDHDVPVLRIETAEGKLQAVLFGYACHSTTLGFYQFCGDYPGFAQRCLEAAHPEVTALFVAGCGADQNPYPRRTLELAEQHGRSLANAVEAALLTQAQPIGGKLGLAYGTVTLEYQTPPTRDQLLQQAESKNKYDRFHAQLLLKQLEADGKVRDHYPCPIQVVRFGQVLTMVPMAGETVVDYSLRLKRELGGAKQGGTAVWVPGYCNDVFAYIPSRRVLEEGGYEGGGAMKYFTTIVQPGPFAPSVEELLISGIHTMNRGLQESMDHSTPGASSGN